jgi:hypothetical protein
MQGDCVGSSIALQQANHTRKLVDERHQPKPRRVEGRTEITRDDGIDDGRLRAPIPETRRHVPGGCSTMVGVGHHVDRAHRAEFVEKVSVSQDDELHVAAELGRNRLPEVKCHMLGAGSVRVVRHDDQRG